MITKGGCTDFQGIGLVEVMWKVITGIINHRLSSSISFQNVLNVFCAGRRTGTTTLEAKLLQQLTAMREAVLHYILLDLRKAYDALDRYLCLYILVGYDVGPRKIRILQAYWARLQMAAKAGGHYGPAFHSHRGVTQGEPL